MHNQITGTRNNDSTKRDRSDWKKVKTRPAHLRLPNFDNQGQLPTITEEEPIFNDDYDKDLYAPTTHNYTGPITRSARSRQHTTRRQPGTPA